MKLTNILLFLVAALCSITGGVAVLAAESAKVKDAESAAHGGDAAAYQIVDTYTYAGFSVVQFNLPVLSHYSYILMSDKEALVVDPGRDIAAYMELIRKEGLTVKGVFLTHSHADFVAGHMEFAKATGSPIYKSPVGSPGFTYKPTKEGSVLKVGKATVTFVEAPGHTPDMVCGYVSGSAEPGKPEVIFTGDALFVGSIGRPDLLEGTVTAASLASMAFDTWQNKLAKAGDNAIIFPAHGAGSLCGARLSDKPFSTIGAEKAANPYVQHKTRSEFIAAVLEGLPEAPQYFKHNAAINRKGPDPVDWNAPLPDEVPATQALTDSTKHYVVDVRRSTEYAAGHIPNSVNIGLRGRFETWVGTLVPWEANLVLCGGTPELLESVRRLHRVGYRAGVITPESWKKAGLPWATNALVKPADLFEKTRNGTAPLVIDVRLPNEWMGLRIGTVVNLPLTHLSELSAKLDPAQPVVTVCNSAYRSSMAVGLLERKGFRQIASLAGGSKAWIEAGLPVHGAETGQNHDAGGAKQAIRLADRISPDDLKRLMMDLPGTFDLVDIRPAPHFLDYNLPGSKNVDIGDLLNNPAYLAGDAPLIVVDRDGSLAMQVAGILSQKTQRPIRALHGGLVAFWEQTERRRAVKEVPLPPPARPGTAGPAPHAPAAPPPTTPQAPGVSKKKSAGC